MPTFDHIILNGRPGGGKSELIDFLKHTPAAERAAEYHVGDFVELDDFVWLWEKFVEDDLWEAMGEPRKWSYTVPHGYVQNEGDRLLEMFMRKLGGLVERDYLSNPAFYDDGTLFVEFARGVPDGGYRAAYDLLAKEVLSRSAIIYVDVSFEESWARNEARYEAALAHSILAHKLPDESLERFSRHQDFEELTGGARTGYLEIKGISVPFISMPNAPKLKDRADLQARYQPTLQTLWQLYADRPGQ